MTKVCSSVPGYSDARQYSFFRTVFGYADVSRVLLLGVYFGRDIIFMVEAARRAGRRISITAVDKFSDDACADWPSTLRSSTWAEAGFGPAPTLEAAAQNVGRLAGDAEVVLVKQHDSDFLAACQQKFDLVYIDTSHDYETVGRQIRQAVSVVDDGGLLAGDDYSDEGTWGVRRAVTECVPAHAIFADWIWFAAREDVLAQ